MATQQQLLQELFILATGRPANTPNLAALEDIVGHSGNLHALDGVINTYMDAQEARLGTIGIVRAVARHALGREITYVQALQAAADLEAAGLDTWAKIFHWLASNDTALTATLDHRAEAAVHFTNALAAAGKTAYFTGSITWNAATTLIQAVDDATQSLDNAKEALSSLSAAISADGIDSKVVDGYIAGASVIADTNGNGVLDWTDANDDGAWDPGEGEWFTVTDAAGNYTLPHTAPPGTIIANGGIDLLTNKPFQGVLTAPAGSTVVTPLTTLVQSLVDAGLTVASAQNAVSGAFELPATVNPLTYDPLQVLESAGASAADKADALAVQATALQVMNVITQASNAISAATGSTSVVDSGKAVANAIAAAIRAAAATGSTVDLSHLPTLTSIVTGAAAATTSGTSISSSLIAQVARIASDSNSETRAADDLAQLAKVAAVTQGEVTEAIKDGAGSGNLSQAVNDFTGTNLNDAINNNETPPAPEPEPQDDSPGFAVALDATTSTVTFSGNTTDDIDVDVVAALATFSRGTLTATTQVDLTPAGTPTPVPRTLSLASSQTLVVDAGDAAAFIDHDTQFNGAGAIKALDLSVEQYETLDFSNVGTVTVTIADEFHSLIAATAPAYQKIDATITNAATIGDLDTIDSKWGTVTPTAVSDKFSNVSGSKWASPTIDVILTSSTDLTMSQLKTLDAQWGTVTLVSAGIKDSAANILAASSEPWVNAATPVNITGTVSLSQLASIDELWGAVVYQTVSGTAAELSDKSGKYMDKSVNVTVTDGASISQLQQIDNVWGSVTFTHVKDAADTIVEKIHYVGNNTLVTLTDTTVSLNDLAAIEAATQVAIDAAAVQTISGDSNAIWEFYDNALFFGNWVAGLGDEALLLDNARLGRSSITNLKAFTTGTIDIGGVGDLRDSFSNIAATLLDDSSVVGIANLAMISIENVGHIDAAMLEQLIAIDAATGDAEIELIDVTGITGPTAAVNAVLASPHLLGLAGAPVTLTDTPVLTMTVEQFGSAYATLDDGDTVNIVDTSANIQAALTDLTTKTAKIAGINSTQDATPIVMGVTEFGALHALLDAGDTIHVTGSSSFLGFYFSTLMAAVDKLDLIDSTQDDTPISIDSYYFPTLGGKLNPDDTVHVNANPEDIMAMLDDLVANAANIDAIKSYQADTAIDMDVSQFLVLGSKLDAGDTIHVNDTAANIHASLDALASNAAKVDELDSTDPGAGVSYTFAQFIALEHALLKSDLVVLEDSAGNLDGKDLGFSDKVDYVLAQGVATFGAEVPYDEVDAPGEWAFKQDTGALRWWSGDVNTGQRVTITLAGVASVETAESFLMLEYGTFS